MLVASEGPHVCLRRNSRSQFKEDIKLLPFLQQVPPCERVFVELGALDGIRGSNTLMLERCFGWSGLLIEASPANFERLQASGRKAYIAHSAICRGHGTVGIHEGGVWSTEAEVMDSKYMRLAARYGTNISTRPVAVPCRSLTSLMGSAGLAHAAFLSLDVQGVEDKVLEAVDPAVFSLVLVEMDGTNRAKNQRVERRLMQSGFRYANATLNWIFASRAFVKNNSEWAEPTSRYLLARAR